MKFGRRTLIMFIFVLLALLLVVALLRPSPPTQIGSAEFSAQGYRVGDEASDLVKIRLDAITLPQSSRVAGDAAFVTLGGQPIVVSGQVDGDLVLIGGDITLEAGSRVTGDVSVIGGKVVIDGQINGEVTVSGSSLVIGDGARVAGSIDTCDVPDVTAPAGVTVKPCTAIEPLSPAAEQLLAGIWVTFVSGISVLAVVVLPRQIAQIEDAMRRRALRLSGAGIALIALLVGISAGLALLVAAVPPLGFVAVPLFLLMLLALAIMSLLGTVPIYIAVGEWLLRRFGSDAPPLVAVLVGAVAINSGLVLLSFVPVLMWVGPLISLGMFILSLGAAFDTRLGTRRRERSYFVQG